jgi:hypothetical protein
MSESDGFPNKEVQTQARIKEAKQKLTELLSEKAPFDGALRSSGKLLADRYVFEIKALETGKEPEAYRRLGEVANPEIAKITFGSHEDDMLTPSFGYGGITMDKLEEQKTKSLWRLKDQKDYVK